MITHAILKYLYKYTKPRYQKNSNILAANFINNINPFSPEFQNEDSD